MKLIEGGMVVDAALQAEICGRIVAAGLGEAPDAPAHGLGVVALPGGDTVALHVRHAADAIIISGGQVVLVRRLHNPGVGKLALPGGFLDMVAGVVETGYAAALREADEESGIDPALLRQCGVHPVGPRRYHRPADIRVAWNNLPGTEIRPGDLFGVSTQGFVFRLAALDEAMLQAGDDAGSVHVLKIAALTADDFAVPDHLEMIQEALR